MAENTYIVEAGDLIRGGSALMQEAFMHQYDVVFVPIATFHAVYADKHPSHHISPTRASKASEGRIQRIVEGLEAGNDLQIPRMGVAYKEGLNGPEPDSDAPMVHSGRHRFAALSRMGQDEMPVLVPKVDRPTAPQEVATAYGGRIAGLDEMQAIYGASLLAHEAEIDRTQQRTAQALRREPDYYSSRRQSAYIGGSGRGFPYQEKADCLHYFSNGEVIVVEPGGMQYSPAEILRSEYAACYTGDLACDIRVYDGDAADAHSIRRLQLRNHFGDQVLKSLLEHYAHQSRRPFHDNGEITVIGADPEEIADSLGQGLRYYSFADEYDAHDKLRRVLNDDDFPSQFERRIRDAVRYDSLSFPQAFNKLLEELLVDPMALGVLLEHLPQLQRIIEDRTESLSQYRVFTTDNQTRPSIRNLDELLPTIADIAFNGFIQTMYGQHGGPQQQVARFKEAFGLTDSGAFPYVFASFNENLDATIQAFGMDRVTFLQNVPMDDIATYTGLSMPQILHQLGYAHGQDGVVDCVNEVYAGRWDRFIRANYGTDVNSLLYEFDLTVSDLVAFTSYACQTRGSESITEILALFWGDEAPFHDFLEAAYLNHPGGIDRAMERLAIDPSHPEQLVQLAGGRAGSIASAFGLHVGNDSHLRILTELAGRDNVIRQIGLSRLIAGTDIGTVTTVMGLNEAGLLQVAGYDSLTALADRQYSNNFDNVCQAFDVSSVTDLTTPARFTPDIVMNTLYGLAENASPGTIFAEAITVATEPAARTAEAEQLFNFCFGIEASAPPPPMDAHAVAHMLDVLETLFDAQAVSQLRETHAAQLEDVAIDAQVDRFTDFAQAVAGAAEITVARHADVGNDTVIVTLPPTIASAFLRTMNDTGITAAPVHGAQTTIHVTTSQLAEHDFGQLAAALQESRAQFAAAFHNPDPANASTLLEQCLAPPFNGDFAAIVAAAGGNRYAVRDALRPVLDQIPKEHFESLYANVFPNNFDAFNGYRELAGIEYTPEGLEKLKAITGLSYGEIQGRFFTSSAHGNAAHRFGLDATNPDHAEIIHDIYDTPEVANPAWERNQLSGGFIKHVRSTASLLSGRGYTREGAQNYEDYMSAVLRNNRSDERTGIQNIAHEFGGNDITATLIALTDNGRRSDSFLRGLYGLDDSSNPPIDWAQLAQDSSVEAARAVMQLHLVQWLYRGEAPGIIRHLYDGNVEAFITDIRTQNAQRFEDGWNIFPDDSDPGIQSVILHYTFQETEQTVDIGALMQRIYPEGPAFALEQQGIDLAVTGPAQASLAISYYQGDLAQFLEEQHPALLQWAEGTGRSLAELYAQLHSVFPDFPLEQFILGLGGVEEVVDQYYRGDQEAFVTAFGPEAARLDGIDPIIQLQHHVGGTDIDIADVADAYDLPLFALETQLTNAFGGSWEFSIENEAELQLLCEIPNEADLQFIDPNQDIAILREQLTTTLSQIMDLTATADNRGSAIESLRAMANQAAENRTEFNHFIQHTALPALNIMANGSRFDQGAHQPAQQTICFNNSEHCFELFEQSGQAASHLVSADAIQAIITDLEAQPRTPDAIQAALGQHIETHIEQLDAQSQSLTQQQEQIEAQQRIVANAEARISQLETTIQQHQPQIDTIQNARYNLPQPPAYQRAGRAARHNEATVVTDLLRQTGFIEEIVAEQPGGKGTPIEPTFTRSPIMGYSHSYLSFRSNEHRTLRPGSTFGQLEPDVSDEDIATLNQAFRERFSEYHIEDSIFHRSKTDPNKIHFNPLLLDQIQAQDQQAADRQAQQQHGTELLRYMIDAIQENGFGNRTEALTGGITARQLSDLQAALPHHIQIYANDQGWYIESGPATRELAALLRGLDSQLRIEERGNGISIPANEFSGLRVASQNFHEAWQQVHRNHNEARYREQHIAPIEQQLASERETQATANQQLATLVGDVVTQLDPANTAAIAQADRAAMDDDITLIEFEIPTANTAISLIESALEENARTVEALRGHMTP